ncbi:4-hydroxy-3-methylbut-2-en-1-yl diphosphate synthase domain protein [Anaplasma phagocytophilum str. ApNP]|uniref:4-hydroxy-3-methylbut-2-en-1-yl diphosphate synthase domain protein n=1 Tax=Anaplasma phagocytophilum str. ApNP TaxID=1359153 RepID=A0A0F3NE03_ANAPH|nr:4-hydroxy-3-methylbut-2-en-1-yl diphosphate synthase domain protein [Anaplasma phagocytophilum str. ApNP]
MRVSQAVRVGKVTIGGGHPVVVQSMALGVPEVLIGTCRKC